MRVLKSYGTAAERQHGAIYLGLCKAGCGPRLHGHVRLQTESAQRCLNCNSRSFRPQGCPTARPTRCRSTWATRPRRMPMHLSSSMVLSSREAHDEAGHGMAVATSGHPMWSAASARSRRCRDRQIGAPPVGGTLVVCRASCHAGRLCGCGCISLRQAGKTPSTAFVVHHLTGGLIRSRDSTSPEPCDGGKVML